jgi:hypothetical protein
LTACATTVYVSGFPQISKRTKIWALVGWVVSGFQLGVRRWHCRRERVRRRGGELRKEVVCEPQAWEGSYVVSPTCPGLWLGKQGHCGYGARGVRSTNAKCPNISSMFQSSPVQVPGLFCLALWIVSVPAHDEVTNLGPRSMLRPYGVVCSSSTV